MKICTLVNLIALIANLIVAFQDFICNSVFWQIGPKTKILIDLLENSHSRLLKALNANPIQTFHDFYSKPKFGQSGTKIKILPDLLENLHTSQFKGPKQKPDIDILTFYPKYKSWQIEQDKFLFFIISPWHHFSRSLT